MIKRKVKDLETYGAYAPQTYVRVRYDKTQFNKVKKMQKPFIDKFNRSKSKLNRLKLMKNIVKYEIELDKIMKQTN